MIIGKYYLMIDSGKCHLSKVICSELEMNNFLIANVHGVWRLYIKFFSQKKENDVAFVADNCNYIPVDPSRSENPIPTDPSVSENPVRGVQITLDTVLFCHSDNIKETPNFLPAKETEIFKFDIQYLNEFFIPFSNCNTLRNIAVPDEEIYIKIHDQNDCYNTNILKVTFPKKAYFLKRNLYVD